MSLNLDTVGWERRSLGDVARASKEKVDPKCGGVERYIAGEHMETDDLKIHRWGDVREVDLGPAFHRRFRPGQVLYGSRRTYLRKVAVAEFDGVCANTTFVVETKDENVLLPEFLPFIMTSEPFHAFAIAESKGSVNPYVNWSDIDRFEFDLPPLDEQKRIADLLWATELHRASLDRQIRSVLGSLRLFLRTQFDLPAMDRAKIADLCSTVIGGVWGSPEGENEVDALALGPRVYADGAIWLSTEGSPVRSISQKQAELRVIQPGDIILERSGGSPEQPVGRVVIAGRDVPKCIPTDFQRLLRPDNSRVEPLFLFWRLRLDWLEGLTRDFSKRTTNIANLSIPAYLDRIVELPTRDAQRLLLEDLKLFEQALKRLSSERESVNELRSAALADIFGGN